jgi:hypothetical protein
MKPRAWDVTIANGGEAADGHWEAREPKPLNDLLDLFLGLPSHFGRGTEALPALLVRQARFAKCGGHPVALVG